MANRDVLSLISAYKREEIRSLKKGTSVDELAAQAAMRNPARGFADRLKQVAHQSPAIIAEIKKASPSKNVIREHFDPIEIAKQYIEGGATCLSVLTDGPSFQGSVEIFQDVRRVSDLPMLRKDFILDPIQVLESRAIGADAILVIMAMLDDQNAEDIMLRARNWGMDVLVETHSADEITRALDIGAQIIGINNRNLRTFETSLNSFPDLAALIPPNMPIIAESGISNRENIEFLTRHGATGFLIGESLMRSANIELRVRQFSGV